MRPEGRKGQNNGDVSGVGSKRRKGGYKADAPGVRPYNEGSGETVFLQGHDLKGTAS